MSSGGTTTLRALAMPTDKFERDAGIRDTSRTPSFSRGDATSADQRSNGNPSATA